MKCDALWTSSKAYPTESFYHRPSLQVTAVDPWFKRITRRGGDTPGDPQGGNATLSLGSISLGGTGCRKLSSGQTPSTNKVYFGVC